MTELAQSLPEPNSYAALGWLVVGLTCLLLTARAIVGLKKDLRDEPAHPPNPALHVAHQELHTRHGALEQRVGGIEKSVTILRKEQQDQTDHLTELADQRAKDIYDHIDGVRRELTGDIKSVEAKMGQVPAEVVALLKHTKGLL